MQLTALHGSTNSACVKGCAACLSVRPKRLGGILQCLPPMPPSKRPAPLHVGQAMAARDTHVHVHWHKLELTLEKWILSPGATMNGHGTDNSCNHGKSSTD